MNFRDLFDLGLPPIVEHRTYIFGNNYCIGYQEMNEMSVIQGDNPTSAHLIIGTKDPATSYESVYTPKVVDFNKRYSHKKLKDVDTMPIGSTYQPDYDLNTMLTYQFRNNKEYLLLQSEANDRDGIYISNPIMFTYPFKEDKK